MKTPTHADTLLDALAQLSNFYGQNPDYVLAGGGNTSVKVSDTLYIKGSGTELAKIRADQFVGLNRTKVAETLSKKYSADPLKREEEIKNDLLAARTEPEKGGRPSVETALHNMFEAPFVVHLHPWLVNTITCALDGEKTAKKLFGDTTIWLPYTDPGYTLAKAVEKELLKYRSSHSGKDPEYLIIQNHGPFIPARDAAEADKKIEALFRKLQAFHNGVRSPFKKPKPVMGKEDFILLMGPALRAALAEEGQLKIVRFGDSPLVMEFVATEEGRKCVKSGPLTPDQIVYCKSFPLWIPCSDEDDPESVVERFLKGLADFRKKRNYDPKVVAVEGVGLFAVGDTTKSATTILDVYIDALKIVKGTYAAGGPRFLTPKQYRFIDEWEVEQYRRKVSASASSSAGRVQNKVVVITGAAHGSGRAIAMDMAKEGAFLALLDSNGNALQEVGSAAAGIRGEGCVFAYSGEISDADFMGKVMTDIMRNFGGVDAVINAVEPQLPVSLMDMDGVGLENWMDACFKGLFHCVRFFSSSMTVQNVLGSSVRGDIIHVSSRYDGFGMAQQFSQELDEEGVKVNGIHVAEHDHSHEGCNCASRGNDLMQAVYYLISQQSESGLILKATHA